MSDIIKWLDECAELYEDPHNLAEFDLSDNVYRAAKCEIERLRAERDDLLNLVKRLKCLARDVLNYQIETETLD